MIKTLKLGTRGSALARAQSQWVAEQISAASGFPVQLEIIETKGDRIQDRPLKQVGGKGLFTKEVEDALLSGSVDFAVHSMKDMPTEMPDGLVFGCIPVREDPRDVLVGAHSKALTGGTIVGTGSARREALLNDMYRGLDIRGIRGNVDTRVAKQRAGQYDVVVLAAAGLKRLGRGDDIDVFLPPTEMVPAVGQGALAVQCREDDIQMLEVLAQVHCSQSALCVGVERAFLTEMGGGCSVPVACHVTLDSGCLDIRAAFLTPSGALLRAHHNVPVREGEVWAKRIAREFQQSA